MTEHQPLLPQTPAAASSESVRGRPPRLPWSEQELEALRRLTGENLGDDEIAARLGRTQRAVRTMILRQGGQRLREASRPWSKAELETAARLHASGAICAIIAKALPGRTPIAIFRKLCRVVGPAPSAEAKRSWRAAKSSKTTAEEAAGNSLIRVRHPLPPPRPPQQPIAATLDAMVCWLRSRDYMVLRRNEGWQVDHHHLSDDEALVVFVNLRRVRLHLPSFVPVEPRVMPAAIVSQMERGRRWGRPHQAVRRV